MDAERDFFISYTQADRAWAEWLAWELEAAGHTTMLQAWDIPPGSAFTHVMDQATQRTRYTVLVLSSTYLRSAMAEAEWRPGFVDDPSGERRRLLPVRVEPCEPKGLLADRVYIDLVGLDEATARARLREEIAAALRGHARPTVQPRFPRTPAAPEVARPRFPTALPPVWNVPFQRNPSFTGREQQLATLAQALERGGTVAVTQVLHGGGGIGKTALAAEYAWRQGASLEAVWWVRAETPTTLVGDYAELASALGLSEAAQPDQHKAVMTVRRWLEDHDRWLLVLDNAEAPDTPSGLPAPLGRVVDLLPRVVPGQVLVTSRDARWEEHATLTELDAFTSNEAVAFLLTRSGSSDQATATHVAALLGWLPLALEQAGAYVRETRIPLSAYLERLQRFPALTLARGRPRDRDPADTVASTWQVSLERVQPVPGAVAVLEMCAFLGPEEIPRELFAQRLDPAAGRLDVLADDLFTLDEAIGALRRFGLAKADERTLTVHRLLQQIIRDSLDPATAASRVGTAVQLLAAAFPAEGFDEPGVWPVCAQLLPHALAVTGHAERDQVELAATSALLDEAERYLHGRARYAEARALAERALALAEPAFGPEDAIISSRLGNLGLVLRDQGDLDTARMLHERALAIRETRLGPNHPDTAASLASLGGVLHNQGDLDTARMLHERALAIYETRRGADHPDIARSLSDLAYLLRDQGDLDGARTLLERALAICEARLGPDYPATAWSLSNLASVLRDQGDLDGAYTLHQRALAIYEMRMGPDHFLTAQSLNDLASVLRDQGDLDGAHTLLERALAIRETRLGPDHPDTARGRQNLARVVAELENPQ